MAESSLPVGSVIKARHMASSLGKAGTSFYPGKIVKCNKDGSFNVQYDDGDFEKGVKREFIKAVKGGASLASAALTVAQVRADLPPAGFRAPAAPPLALCCDNARP